MGSNRAVWSEPGQPGAIVGRHKALNGGNSRPAGQRAGRSPLVGSRRGTFGLHGKKLIVLLTGVVVAIAAIVAFAATAAARRGTAAQHQITTAGATGHASSL